MGGLIPGFMGIGPSGLPYFQRVLHTESANLIAYWPLWESSGSTAEDQSDQGNDAAYNVDIDLGATGIGDGNTCVSSDGTANSEIDIYSAGLNSDFDGSEFEFHCFIKPDAGFWDDGATRLILRIWVDSNNYIQIYKSTADDLYYQYKAGGTSKATFVRDTEFVTEPYGWISVGLAVSATDDEMICLLNGTQAVETVTGLGTWAGNLDSGKCNISDYTNTLPGDIAHAALWSGGQLSRAQRRKLAYSFYQPLAIFFGDSIVDGTDASDDAHRWINLVAADQGWTYFIEEGIGGTVLQNTTQNTVSTIGGAADNNGRDTYDTRVTAYNPDYVFILYGLNDLRLDDAAFTTALFENDLGEVVQGIIDNGASADHIIIGSPPYVSDYGSGDWGGGSTADHEAHVQACADVASAKGTKYIDVYQWMIDNGGDSLVSGDDIHPNDDGHQEIANAFLSVL